MALFAFTAVLLRLALTHCEAIIICLYGFTSYTLITSEPKPDFSAIWNGRVFINLINKNYLFNINCQSIRLLILFKMDIISLASILMAMPIDIITILSFCLKPIISVMNRYSELIHII